MQHFVIPASTSDKSVSNMSTTIRLQLSASTPFSSHPLNIPFKLCVYNSMWSTLNLCFENSWIVPLLHHGNKCHSWLWISIEIHMFQCGTVANGLFHLILKLEHVASFQFCEILIFRSCRQQNLLRFFEIPNIISFWSCLLYQILW